MAYQQQQSRGSYFGQGEVDNDDEYASDEYGDILDNYQSESIEGQHRHRQPVDDDIPQPIQTVQDHISSMTRRVRRFGLQISGSLKQLQVNSCKPQGGSSAEVFNDEEIFKHRSRDSVQGAPRFGNAKKAVVLCVKVCSYQSTFPVTMLVCSNIFPGNLYTSTPGQRAFYMVKAGASKDFGDKGPVIYHPPVTDFSDLSKAYEDLTESELHAQVMTDPAMPENKLYLVPQDHPIAKILCSPNNQQGIDSKTGETFVKYTIGTNHIGIKKPFDINTMSTGTLQVPEDFYAAARECLSGVISRLPHKPLKGMRFWAERAFQKNFISPHGELSKYGCSSRAAHLSVAVSTDCSLTMELEIQYSLQGVESQASAFQEKLYAESQQRAQ